MGRFLTTLAVVAVIAVTTFDAFAQRTIGGRKLRLDDNTGRWVEIDNNDRTVGIGTTSPDPSAILQVDGLNPTGVFPALTSPRGVLFPRMTTADRNSIIAPANGLLIYNTDINAYQFYNGGTFSWEEVGGGWLLEGNITLGAGTQLGQSFIGTQNAQDFVIATNPGVPVPTPSGEGERIRVTAGGFVGISNDGLPYFPNRLLDVGGVPATMPNNALPNIRFNSLGGTPQIVPALNLTQDGITIADVSGDLIKYDIATVVGAVAWLRVGNTIMDGNNILGTLNNVDIDIRTNNTNSITVLAANQNVGIKNMAPAYDLDVNGTLHSTGNSDIATNGGTNNTFGNNSANSNNIGNASNQNTIGFDAVDNVFGGVRAANQTNTYGSSLISTGDVTNDFGHSGGSGNLVNNFGNNTGTGTATTNIGIIGSTGINIGNTLSAVRIEGETQINSNMGNSTEINTGTSTGDVTIGNMSGVGPITISSDVNDITINTTNGAGSDLVLNGIESPAFAGNLLWLTGANEVRQSSPGGLAEQGITWDLEGGNTRIRLGGLNNAANPISVNRFVNINGGVNLSFGAAGSANRMLVLNGSNQVDVNVATTGATNIGNTTGGITMLGNPININNTGGQTTNIANGAAATVNIGLLAGTNNIRGTTNINDNVNNNTNINTGTSTGNVAIATGATSGTVNIGSTTHTGAITVASNVGGGGNAITLDVSASATNNLRLLNIAPSALTDDILWINASSQVRRTSAAGLADEGLMFQTGAIRLGGNTNLINPIVSNRFVNITGPNVLSFGTTGSANRMVALTGGTDQVDINFATTGSTNIGNTTGNIVMRGATVGINAATAGTTNIGQAGNTNNISGTTNINASVNSNTNINTGSSTGSVAIATGATAGTVNIGSTVHTGAITIASNTGSAITLDVTNTGNNLIMNNIAADPTVLNLLALTGANSGNVRTIGLSGLANEGIMFQSGAFRLGANALGTNPIVSNRIVTINNTFSLSFQSQTGQNLITMSPTGAGNTINIGLAGNGSNTIRSSSNIIEGNTDINDGTGNTTNIATGVAAATNIGTMGGVNNIEGTTNVNVGIASNTNINTGASTGNVAIGNQAGASGSITISADAADVTINTIDDGGGAGADLVLNGIEVDNVSGNLLWLTGANEVRQANSSTLVEQGLTFNNEGGNTRIRLGGLNNAANPITTNRFVNISAINTLSFGTTGSVGRMLNMTGGTDQVNINTATTGSTGIGNSTGSVTINGNTVDINESSGLQTRIATGNPAQTDIGMSGGTNNIEGTTNINTVGTDGTNIGTAGGATNIGADASTNTILGATNINTTNTVTTSIGQNMAGSTTNLNSTDIFAPGLPTTALTGDIVIRDGANQLMVSTASFVTSCGTETALRVPLFTAVGPTVICNSYLVQSSAAAGGTLTSDERLIVNSTVSGNMVTVNNFDNASTAIKINANGGIGINVDPASTGIIIDATSVGIDINNATTSIDADGASNLGNGAGNDALNVLTGTGAANINNAGTANTNIGNLTGNVGIRGNNVNINSASAATTNIGIAAGNNNIIGTTNINQSSGSSTNIANLAAATINMGDPAGTINMRSTTNINVTGGSNTNIATTDPSTTNIGMTTGTNNILGATNINVTGGATTNIATTTPSTVNIGALTGTNNITGSTNISSGTGNIRLNTTSGSIRLITGANVGSDAAPTSTLHVRGSVAAGVASGGTVALGTNDYFYLVTSDNQTITLPAANTCAGRMYTIKNNGFAVVFGTTVASGGGNIDGAATTAIVTSLGAMQFISDGTNWWITSSN